MANMAKAIPGTRYYMRIRVTNEVTGKGSYTWEAVDLVSKTEKTALMARVVGGTELRLTAEQFGRLYAKRPSGYAGS